MLFNSTLLLNKKFLIWFLTADRQSDFRFENRFKLTWILIWNNVHEYHSGHKRLWQQALQVVSLTDATYLDWTVSISLDWHHTIPSNLQGLHSHLSSLLDSIHMVSILQVLIPIWEINLVTTLPADVPAPDGAGPSAGTVLTMQIESNVIRI